MKNSVLPLLALFATSFGLALAVPAVAAPAADNVDRAQVLGKLRVINQTEIKAGQMAEEKGTTPEVKDFGRKLVTDHKKLDDDVNKFATDSKVSVPDLQPSDEDKTAVDDMQNATGPDFDKKFLATMIKGHEDALNMVKTAKNETKDPHFKHFLATVVPSLERHHATAEKIEKKVSM